MLRIDPTQKRRVGTSCWTSLVLFRSVGSVHPSRALCVTVWDKCKRAFVSPQPRGPRGLTWVGIEKFAQAFFGAEEDKYVASKEGFVEAWSAEGAGGLGGVGVGF